MAKKDYLPNEVDDLDTWYQTWLNGISAVLTALGLAGTHADATKTKVTQCRTSFQTWKDLKQDASEASENFKTDRGGAEDAIRPYSKNLKSTPGYTTALGASIGIEGPEESVDPSTAKPKVKASYEGGEVVLKFNTHPAARSIRFNSKRASEMSFTFLSDDTNPPYNDNRQNLDPSKPENREYTGQYVDKSGNLIGQPSDIVKITVP